MSVAGPVACCRYPTPFYCRPDCQRERWDDHAQRIQREPEAGVVQRRVAIADWWAAVETFDPLLACRAKQLPRSQDAILLRPPPDQPLRWLGGTIVEISGESVERLRGTFDTVIDAGQLEHHGLVMHLRKYRWDVLGRVKDALQCIFGQLALLRPGGCLLLSADAEPIEYLVSFFTAFGEHVEPRVKIGSSGRSLVELVLHRPVEPAELAAVLRREVDEEWSHRRYADALDLALSRIVVESKGRESALEVLDVGGGDGHMAEWWGASGHRISVLEVDAEQVRKARARLGEDRVFLHDGASRWEFFEDRSFDVCLLLFVLHHIGCADALRRTLAEARRVTRLKVLIMEDLPHNAKTQGLRSLAAAVTAEHFRPFGQDPQIYMRNIRTDAKWRALFAEAGFRLEDVQQIEGTLQHPVPHTFYVLSPT